MNIIDLIIKKQNDQEFNKKEIKFFIENFVNGKIPDYQMAALLMAIYFKNMSYEETYNLTVAMIESGNTFDLQEIKEIKIDKHSTGGIGDKVSLILPSIIASFGINISKMSGRGLGITGGTIDKLESINGFKFNYSHKEFIEKIKSSKIMIIGQTEDIVPADKVIYALRDATATVQSIPLIAASIMAKKLAINSNIIFIDLKVGDGAFMKNLVEAKKLGLYMKKIAEQYGRKIVIHFTNMNKPLGRAIGNKIELIEAKRFLLNQETSDDLKSLIYDFCVDILIEANLYKSKNEALKAIKETIFSGQAYKNFKKWIINQNGDFNHFESNNFWKPIYKKEIISIKEGYVQIINPSFFGKVAVNLGAGRQKKGDKLDYDAGIFINKKTNEYVKKNNVILTLYSSNPISDSNIEIIKKSIIINKEKHQYNMIIDKF